MVSWNRVLPLACALVLPACRQAPRIVDGGTPPVRVVQAAVRPAGEPGVGHESPLSAAARPETASESLRTGSARPEDRPFAGREQPGRVQLAESSAPPVPANHEQGPRTGMAGASLLTRVAHREAAPVPAAEEPGSEPAPLRPVAPLQIVGVFALAELESLALERNPSIRQASAVAHKALGTRTQVGLRPNPTISYTGQEIFDDDTYGQQGVQVAQTHVRGDKLRWNERVLDQEVQSLLWQVEAQRQRVLTDVRRQFYETLGAQERVRLLQELEGISDEAADNARILVENAQGARPDQLQAEVQLNEISVLRRQAEFEHEANWRQLANLVGSPDLPAAELDHVLEVETGVRDWDLVRQQLAGSPQLMQAYAEAQRARTLVSRAQVQPIPNIEWQIAGIQMAGRQFRHERPDRRVPLPPFNRNQGNIDARGANCTRPMECAAAATVAAAQLAAAFGSTDAANRVATYRDEIVPRQQESLELISLGFPAQFDFLRLWTARRSYYEARVDYLNAVVDLRQAEVLIDGLMLTGGLGEVQDTTLDDGLRDAALTGE